ncbi:MAG: DNA polymerase III subunit gamma/tau [Candidatus Taylorbacteria bacterium]|nr:DNA polymerase III subunit gamma/tau [Candidatus Taylorbacteria bacterium]
MQSLVLYRKYRPEKWSEVAGQDHVVKVLQGALSLGRLSHAYLFAGSRGTGKTSVARILARELGTAPADIYEIDAASNRGIDDVRALREAVAVLPFSSPYKVYIVDEVHMLTKEAFNALLKTLEEPPPHAVFILATTEVEKLPETIVSRCEMHTFRKPSRKVLAEVVARAAKREGLSLEAEAAELIALLADGSFRDAFGILQKTASFSKDDKISASEVEAATGAPPSALVRKFVAALSERQADECLKVVRRVAEGGADMSIFLRRALEWMRSILLLRFAKEMESELSAEFSPDDFAALKKMAEDKGSAVSADCLRELLSAADMLRYAALPTLPLELAVIKLLGQNN